MLTDPAAIAERPLLVLASGSRYRAELLSRLQLPFIAAQTDIDESPLPGETARERALRLSLAKAEAARAQHPQAWILGSDQTASLDGQFLDKPGTPERAREQLAQAAGRSIEFLTGLALSLPERHLETVDVTTVQFRPLSARAITEYVEKEPALDCAGGFKCEGLGITLFESIRSDDPTALIGLPLIAVCRMLREAGYPMA